jgi:hypothetical protein
MLICKHSLSITLRQKRNLICRWVANATTELHSEAVMHWSGI